MNRALPVALVLQHTVPLISGKATRYYGRGLADRRSGEPAGVDVGELTFPPERPNGRFRLTEPDGYDLAVTHA